MNNAEKYTKANGMQKRDALDVLVEYVDNLCWSPGDLILDIGCGAGDGTANILLPRLPTNIGQIVGSDLSNAMVNHASASHSHPKLSFTQLDISTQLLDIDKLNDLIENYNDNHGLIGGVFNKLFSFYCLHWVMEQKRAIMNMYKLIKPGGEGLVVFLANCPVFQLYETLAQKTEWKSYMNDVTQFISPYQHSLDPRSEFSDLLEDVGFEVINCSTEKRSFAFGNIPLLKKALQAVNPFYDRIPEDLQEEYLEDCITEVNNLKLVDVVDQNNNVNEGSKIMSVQYELIIAHFKKT